jgi:hypothetical protein
MEPGFHKGEFVLLRTQPSYTTQDIVLYHNPEIGPVFHRIIAIENNRFVLKGDHNAWIDSYRASPVDIVGKYWLRIPWLGSTIDSFRSKEGLVFSLFTLAFLFVGESAGVRNSLGPKKRRKRILKKSNLDGLGVVFSVRDAFLASLVFSLLILVLALFTFSQPTIISVPTDSQYEHFGEFRYSSDASSAIYDNGAVQPGDPIFRQISNRFDLEFAYALSALDSANVKGTYSLHVIIGEANGWKRVLELQPATAFEGSSVSFTTSINVNDVQSYVDQLQEQTGLSLSQYFLTIVPVIEVEGEINGVSWHDQYAPELPFAVNEVQIRLLDTEEGVSSLLSQSEARSIYGQQLEINRINYFGINFSIHEVRLFLILISPIMAGLLLFLGWRTMRLYQADPVTQIQGFYGAKLVNVTGMLNNTSSPAVIVSRIEDLVRMAEREGTFILYEKKDEIHHYFVETPKGLFLFSVEPEDKTNSSNS